MVIDGDGGHRPQSPFHRQPMAETPPRSGNLRRIALVVALATALSKVAGLVRQQAIAAAFGVGAAYDAYNYAYVLPGFLLILLGGINGPFHSAMVSVMARQERQQSARLLAAINTLVGLGLLLVTVVLALDRGIHDLAVVQLRLMAPMALFAGLIGLGFGALNAADEYWLPSISPLLSSVAVLLGLGLLWLQAGAEIGSSTWAFWGGAVLALSTLAGAVLQWLIQLPALARQGLGHISLSFDWRQPGVAEVLRVMGPATLASGMMQVNVYTDLFFASGIAGAAAGLGYAGLLVQTPLGILSNMLLVPLLPVFSRLVEPHQRGELIQRIRQGLMLSNASMLPLGALMIALASPIVALVYERGAFDGQASRMVGSLLMAYGFGMPAYLGRDVLVRVFYALGDANTPFRISVAGIGLNALFDWLLVGSPIPGGLLLPQLNFGAPGLVLATVAVNVISGVVLLVALQRRLGTLPLQVWSRDTALLSLAAVVGGLLAWGMARGLHWPAGLPGLLLQTSLCGLVGAAVYGLLAGGLGVPEARQLGRRLRERLPGGA